MLSAGDTAAGLHFKLLPTVEPAPTRAVELPIVSIVMFVRNRVETVRRAIESVLSQDYPRIHLVVQDGVSTDGTLEILESYGDRIDLVSEPDDGERDGFWRVLQRVKGEIIGTCLSDEQLMPGAIKRGVEELMAAPEVGAITGDTYFSEYSGHVFSTWTGQEFDFLAYLIGDYCPHFSATFFRKSALEHVGMFDSPWRKGRKEPVEFEIWCRLGTQHTVKYVHHTFYKFGCDQGQLSQSISRITEELDRRSAVMDYYLFGEDRFFGEKVELRNFILRRQHEIIINHLNCNADPEAALRIEARMHDVLGLEMPQALRAIFEAEPGSLFRRKCRDLLTKAMKLLATLESRDFPRVIRWCIPAARHVGIQQRALSYYYHLRGIPRDFLRVNPLGIAPLAPVPEDFRGRMYEYMAQRYRDRGLVAQALQMFRKAEVLNDPAIDAAACQLALASPDHTDEDLEQIHRRWSKKHCPPDYHVVHGSFRDRGWAVDGKITVGYHCAFQGDSCADALALPVIGLHDRSRFRVIGYSPFPESAHVQQQFDLFHGATVDYDNHTFAEMVRADGVDVFVELSSLSHFHRYGAMALRAAPVQASYANHLGTTQVANVDYVIGDDVTFPEGSDLYYSETIERLADCVHAYCYDDIKTPNLAPPPCLEKGYVTFGSFGSAFKLNRECLDLWSAVLRAVPQSRFLMQNASMSTASNADFMRKQFRQRGVDPERVMILGDADCDSNLENYALMDISLDSWPCCGGSSLAEALWQGVPVVTLKGVRATAAYGAALVGAAGLAELVAGTPAEFVENAARLAADRPRLVGLRRNLRRMMHGHGLCDPVRMARLLEDTYQAMMTRRFGQSPNKQAQASNLTSS